MCLGLVVRVERARIRIPVRARLGREEIGRGKEFLVNRLSVCLGLVVRVERGRVWDSLRASRGREGTGRWMGIYYQPPVSVLGAGCATREG